ncbi:ribonuclease 3-like protein 2 isoform X2 [Ziziphus jujuba]|uniref:Ribonuclease 3-like protein 2 isoform X2 n=1 Tax=Ziziphus jujuba TaxID=326968 RepID=A0ABM3ZTM6_ZIZJJ|nr:ribonuclease 3-like protein 2 isoform X2 [Ziziphus jujuba]
MILNGLLEPRDIIEENRKLHEICQKMQSKQVEIKHTRDTGSIITASVYMDDHFVASGSSDILETARLNAATLALSKLPQSTPADDDVVAGIDGDVEIEAKTKLNELCQKKKWTEPIYKIDKVLGPPHERVYISSVVVVTPDRMIYTRGDGKRKLIRSENSAASLMIPYLPGPNHV